MIKVIEGLPDHVAAFRASGNITGKDYDKVVNPRVLEVYKKYVKINYLMYIESSLFAFNAEACMKDAVLGFVYFTEWRKVAIVHGEGVKRFTNFFGRFLPGRYYGFTPSELQDALDWVSK
ncbi:MAG: STAS/SEC14 domain-containing protein [Chitinophagaceae bacterium]|nr:STAS/SEC14 domain-containing protein [Chitinophagaceae bacterium]